jgi:hypothetical protein
VHYQAGEQWIRMVVRVKKDSKHTKLVYILIAERREINKIETVVRMRCTFRGRTMDKEGCPSKEGEYT